MVFHPTPSSRLFVRRHADAALRTGVRLVGFSRPGSGGSTTRRSADVVTPLEHARWYAAQIPHNALVVREGLGHLGSFQAHRDETLRDAG